MREGVGVECAMLMDEYWKCRYLSRDDCLGGGGEKTSSFQPDTSEPERASSVRRL